MTDTATSALATQDAEVFRAIEKDKERLRYKLNLIASENYASKAVLEAQGSIMTNKYAEGYPGARYYGGCENVDIVERLAIERAKQLFGAEHANVQPHAGVMANMAVYFAYLQPGDTILGMRLDMGGHLSHGSPVNFSGKLYKIVSYGVRKDTELIDYDEVEKLAKEHKPKIIVVGASAYPRAIDFPRFRAVADEVGALVMTDMAHYAGLIAGGVYPDPVPYSDIVTSTTHKTLRGPRGAFILSRQKHARDIDRSVFPGMQGGPFMHSIAAKAVGFGEALRPEFKQYQKQTLANARALADELTKGGLRIVSGGTDSHIVLADVSPLGTTGKEVEEELAKVGIIVNPNAIPYDTKPPRITSGIRLGTPALTSRGFTEADTRQVAKFILRVVKNKKNDTVTREVADEVLHLAGKFRVPGLDE